MKFRIAAYFLLCVSFGMPVSSQAQQLGGYSVLSEPATAIIDGRLVRLYYAAFRYPGGLLSRALVSNAVMGLVPSCTYSSTRTWTMSKGQMTIEVHNYRGERKFRSCSLSGTWAATGQMLLAAGFPSTSIQNMGLPVMRLYLPIEVWPQPYVTEWTVANY